MAHSNKGAKLGQDCQIPTWGIPDLLRALPRRTMMWSLCLGYARPNLLNAAKLAIKNVTINALLNVIKLHVAAHLPLLVSLYTVLTITCLKCWDSCGHNEIR